MVILDHHLMRCEEGANCLDALSEQTGKRVYCAADYMNRPRWLLEARRSQLYRLIPVPASWHEQYAIGRADAEAYFEETVLEST